MKLKLNILKRKKGETDAFTEKQMEIFTTLYNRAFPDEKSIDLLRFNFGSFTIIASLFPICVASICLMLYFFQSRFSGYLPTISETGTEYPNHVFFGLMISTGAMTTIISFYLYTCYIKIKYNPHYFVICLLTFFTITSNIGITCLSLSPINEAHIRHLIFAATGFLSILLFEIICYIVSEKKSTVSKYRLIALINGTLGFLVFGTSEKWINYRIEMTISTCAEWTLVVFSMTVLISYFMELNSLLIYVAVFD